MTQECMFPISILTFDTNCGTFVTDYNISGFIKESVITVIDIAAKMYTYIGN